MHFSRIAAFLAFTFFTSVHASPISVELLNGRSAVDVVVREADTTAGPPAWRRRDDAVALPLKRESVVESNGPPAWRREAATPGPTPPSWKRAPPGSPDWRRASSGSAPGPPAWKRGSNEPAGPPAWRRENVGTSGPPDWKRQSDEPATPPTW
ncbi:hypothetical protein B0H34DRAFT_679085 [Crassisporium funariophilum]|nr:hypothetical protein B0H34DRAFT_679085 [Crassisporium funariophilum]